MRKPVTLAPLNYITNDEKEALREFLDKFYCVNDPKVLIPIGRARKFRSKKMYQTILNDAHGMYKEEAENESKN